MSWRRAFESSLRRSGSGNKAVPTPINRTSFKRPTQIRESVGRITSSNRFSRSVAWSEAAPSWLFAV
jgi:hypothetical protein